MPESWNPEDVYRQGLEQFSRGEWRAAIETLSQLRDLSDQYPDVDELIADARLKLQFERAVVVPPALPPPRRSLIVPLLGVLALLLLAAGAYGAYALAWSPRQEPVVVAATAAPTPTPVLPTPVPPSATPVPPTATPTPTTAPLLPATLLITAEEPFVNTPANIEIIVDASGSMLAQVPGTDKQRWQIAQEALSTLVTSGAISDRSFTVVRTYGRNRGGDCSDLEVLQPLSRFSAAALLDVIGTIRPAVGGMTPLGASLRAAAADLQAAEGSTAVILVTDGLESCNGDPVAEAAAFVAGNEQRAVHVIGFALERPEESANLRRIADAGHGLYFDATDSAQLAAALRQTIVLSYQVQDSAGQIVAAGEVGGAPQRLEPGNYTLRINANPPIEKALELPAAAEVVVTLRQGFGGLVAEVDRSAP
ncbi:vWA domain-containing protein [Kallotenue papyrolyticum]|uniref:vWA domain-containing protein n=1 Tax=Kallotenue papyrolyticum TaxID=1325125 RepID=UPI0004786172|nr:vWA domain-containing protein [Kallotenue papyrolyticum]